MTRSFRQGMDKSHAGSELAGGWIGTIMRDEHRLRGGQNFTIVLPSGAATHVARLKNSHRFLHGLELFPRSTVSNNKAR